MFGFFYVVDQPILACELTDQDSRVHTPYGHGPNIRLMGTVVQTTEYKMSRCVGRENAGAAPHIHMQHATRDTLLFIFVTHPVVVAGHSVFLVLGCICHKFSTIWTVGASFCFSCIIRCRMSTYVLSCITPTTSECLHK